MKNRNTETQILLTEEEIEFIKEKYNSGLTNPASLVSLLYSRGNDVPYTKLKSMVQNVLGIKDVFKSISQSNMELETKETND